jgi:hypothetical protein
VPLAVAAYAANVAWLGLSGRRWDALPGFALIVVGIPYALAVSERPGFGADAMDIAARLVPALPILAAVKVAGLGALIHAVAKRNHYERRTIARIVGVWLTTVVTLAVLYTRLAPQHSPALATAVAALVVVTPVLGFFAAPLALHANRCR